MNAVEPIDHPDVAATLAVAFTQDPILSFLYEDPSARPAMLTMFFAARLAGGKKGANPAAIRPGSCHAQMLGQQCGFAHAIAPRTLDDH